MDKKEYLLEDFIIPSLKDGRFGKLLKWQDEKRGIFKIRLCHKSNSNWREEDCLVFEAWDRLNDRVVKTKNYYTDSRGRFLNALNKLKRKVKEVRSPNRKKYRLYQLKHYTMNEIEELSQITTELKLLSENNQDQERQNSPVENANPTAFHSLNEENIESQLNFNTGTTLLDAINSENEQNILNSIEGEEMLYFESYNNENVTLPAIDDKFNVTTLLDGFHFPLDKSLENEDHKEDNVELKIMDDDYVLNGDDDPLINSSSLHYDYSSVEIKNESLEEENNNLQMNGLDFSLLDLSI